MLSSALLIDLSKALDCICHGSVIKHDLAMVLGKGAQLLLSYLSDREQMVVQGNDKFVFLYIKGVSQGSVLGPLLFVIPVNDFAFNVPCISILYADDTTFLIVKKDLKDLVKHMNLEIVLKWFKSNSFKVNDQKSEGIVFSLDYSIYKNFKTVKLLGIHIDGKLS